MPGTAGDLTIDSRPPRPRGARSLRLIAAFKALQSLLLTGLALATLNLLRPEVAADLKEWVGDMPLDTQQDLLRRAVTWMLNLHRGHAETIALGAMAYAGLFAVEAFGLWRGRRWAEWLTVIATSSLVPIEIYEVLHRPGIIKVIVIAVNLLVVWILVRALRREPEPR
jgi:uncharacterized membrane protein (DUF2068 family)